QRFPIMEKLGTLYGLPTAQDYEPLAPSAYHELLAPLDAANTDAPLFWGRLLPASRNPGWELLDLLAVRFVVVAPGAAWEAEPSPGPARARRPLLARRARLGREGGAGDRARRLSLPRHRGRPGRARGAVLVCSVERSGGARRDGRDRRPPDRGRPP